MGNITQPMKNCNKATISLLIQTNSNKLSEKAPLIEVHCSDKDKSSLGLNLVPKTWFKRQFSCYIKDAPYFGVISQSFSCPRLAPTSILWPMMSVDGWCHETITNYSENYPLTSTSWIWKHLIGLSNMATSLWSWIMNHAPPHPHTLQIYTDHIG